MIRYLDHPGIDKGKWDAAIDRAVNGNIYAYSWYLDIVSPNWDALVEDAYHAVMPLTWRKKFGIHYLYQPFVTQQLGAFSTEEIDGSTLLEFLETVPKRFRHARIQLNTGNRVPAAHQFSKRVTHHLSLDSTYDQLAAAYSENRKRDLKKSLKAGVQISSQPDSDSWLSQKIQAAGNNVSGVKPRDWRTLQTLLGELERRHLLSVFVAVLEQQTVASAVTVTSGEHVIYLTGFATEKGKQVGASTLLFDHIIKTYAEQPLVLDFEGSMISGIAHFFKSLGGIEVPYWEVAWNRLPWPLKLLKR